MKTKQNTILLFLLVLLFTVYFSACVSFDALIRQGKLLEAEEYCKKLDEDERVLFYKQLADAYLKKRNFDKAEEYYDKTNDLAIVTEGHLELAKYHMYGEIEGKTLTYDLDKVKYYLKKIYDNEQQIDNKIAESFENIANESKKRAEVSKALKDMGIVGMGQGNKMMDIKKIYELSIVRAEIYFLEAINSYEKINNKEKAEELKKELELFKKEQIKKEPQIKKGSRLNI